MTKYIVAIWLCLVLCAQAVTNTMTGTNVVPSGSSFTINSGASATFNGVFNATPTSGTFDMTNTMLKLPGNGTLFLTGGVNGTLILTIGGNTNVTLPSTGTLATWAGTEVLTNKIISLGGNTVTMTIPATGGASRSLSSVVVQLMDTPQNYGAIADGTSHPVSEWIPSRYANLAAVQAVFPDVVSTADEIDWACAMRAVRNSYNIYFGRGSYVFNRTLNTLTVPCVIQGAGLNYGSNYATRIVAPAGEDAIRITGRNSTIRDVCISGKSVSIHSFTGNPAVLTTNTAHGLATAPVIANGWSITGNTVASPTVVATSAAHDLTNADWIKVSGSSGGVIDGFYRVRVKDSTHFWLIDISQNRVNAASDGGACSLVRAYEVAIGPDYADGGYPSFPDITGLTSGTLTVGQVYKIATYVGGNFTNIGAPNNATGIRFRATGTTPADWGGSTLSEITETIGLYLAIPSSSTAMTIYSITDRTALRLDASATADTGTLYTSHDAIHLGDGADIDNTADNTDPAAGWNVDNVFLENCFTGLNTAGNDAGTGRGVKTSLCGVGVIASAIDNTQLTEPWVIASIYSAFMVTKGSGLTIHGGGGASNVRTVFLGADIYASAGSGSGNRFLGLANYFEGFQRNQFADGTWNYIVNAGFDNKAKVDGLTVAGGDAGTCYFYGNAGAELTVLNATPDLPAYIQGTGQIYGDRPSRVHVNLNGSDALTFDVLQYTAGDFEAWSSGNVFGVDIPAASAANIGRKVMILPFGGGTLGGLYQSTNIGGTYKWVPLSGQGTITNDSAPAGYVGELVSSAVVAGSAVSLTTATGANVTSISLTAGDWDVSGNVNFSATTATITATSGGITATSATVPTDGTEVYSGNQTTLLSEIDSVTLPRKRISVASTTTIYLVGQSTFAAGTVSAFGSITARRAR